MNKKLKAVQEGQSCYSDFELSLMRQQLKKGSEAALAVFTEEKYPLDQRIVDARKLALKAQ